MAAELPTRLNDQLCIAPGQCNGCCRAKMCVEIFLDDGAKAYLCRACLRGMLEFFALVEPEGGG
jgi:hypothetical protein